MSCSCKLCQRNVEFYKQLALLESEESKKFFDDIYMTLVETEMDRDYVRCVLDGSWPDALEILKDRVAKISGELL